MTDASPSNAPSERPQTVILLGASNLARAFPAWFGLLRGGCSGPLDLMIAMGHGRSYGQPSRILGRGLPGISQCGLWDQLDRVQPGRRPLALVTDLGNDLMYGVSAEQLLDWLNLSLQRLTDLNSDTVLLSLPMTTLAQLTPRRFEVLRRVLFPRHDRTWPELWQQIERLDAGMRALSQRHQTHWAEASPDWYGWDHIHIRHGAQGMVFRQLFRPWQGWQDPAGPVKIGLYDAWSLRCLRPAERDWFGHPQRTLQPAYHRPNTRIFLF